MSTKEYRTLKITSVHECLTVKEYCTVTVLITSTLHEYCKEFRTIKSRVILMSNKL